MPPHDEVRMNNIFTILLLFSLAVSGQNNNDSAILNKMYNDILNSIPASKRGLIDSAYVISTSKNNTVLSSNKSIDEKDTTYSIDKTSLLSEETRKNLLKMIQQIDTLRQNRIIHFMTNEPMRKQ